MCKAVHVCPPTLVPGGEDLQPAGCTSDQLYPTPYELVHGKPLSCNCGGLDGDEATKWACDQQPYTHWEINLQQQNSTGVSAAQGSLVHDLLATGALCMCFK